MAVVRFIVVSRTTHTLSSIGERGRHREKQVREGFPPWAFSAGGKPVACQSDAPVLGYSYGFEARDLVRIGALVPPADFFIRLLLVPFYWPLIGIYRGRTAAMSLCGCP
jgi:hypothetical protein